jgi:hypothetical protein
MKLWKPLFARSVPLWRPLSIRLVVIFGGVAASTTKSPSGTRKARSFRTFDVRGGSFLRTTNHDIRPRSLMTTVAIVVLAPVLLMGCVVLGPGEDDDD